MVSATPAQRRLAHVNWNPCADVAPSCRDMLHRVFGIHGCRWPVGLRTSDNIGQARTPAVKMQIVPSFRRAVAGVNFKLPLMVCHLECAIVEEAHQCVLLTKQ